MFEEKEKKQIRCAIYTRKSTDEGLDRDFNSLNAQREAAEAYITSQRHEGWQCLPAMYDDGGFSGGNTNRPALQKLMQDIEDGKIDCVVVYKVDRLSRSLMDFAKLMDIFEQKHISFVSVTQQFSTTNSMGRLTLNILLSFAQFEREIITERVRDKVRAAKRKGKWIGGCPVLGYDVAPEGRRLIVNEVEAEQVRTIFGLYLDYGGVLPLVRELKARGWNNKQWVTKKGKVMGGNMLSKERIYEILNNHLYLGEVAFEGEVYAGEHEAIVDRKLWDAVHASLEQNRRKPSGDGGRKTREGKYFALLKGLLHCENCEQPMIPTYTKKTDGKRYRYYVCSQTHKDGWGTCATKALNAVDIENAILDKLKGIGANSVLVKAVYEQKLTEITAQKNDMTLRVAVLKQNMQSHKGRLAALRGGDSLGAEQLQTISETIKNSEEKVKLYEIQIDYLSKISLNYDIFKENKLNFDNLWNNMTMDEQGRLLTLLIDKIYYNGSTGLVRILFNKEVKSILLANKMEVA